MEPHLSTALTNRNHTLDNLFYADTLSIKKKVNSSSEEPVIEKKVGVFCSDLKGLISHLIQCRQIDPEKSDIHIGIDGGQGSVKVGITITNRELAKPSGRLKYAYVS